MGGTGVIDTFLNTFTQYIDSGFGLLQGEVKWLAATLIVIDLVLAALFWAWAPDEDVIARLVKKTLFIGAFAFLINNWSNLSRIVFESFAGPRAQGFRHRPLRADFLRPGRIAQTGLDAGQPILQSISGLWDGMSSASSRTSSRIIVAGWFAWTIVPRLLHPGDPALCQPDRVQADDALRVRAHPLRPLGKNLLCRGTRARQRPELRHQGAGAGRHHRHRLDPLSTSSPRTSCADRPSRTR